MNKSYNDEKVKKFSVSGIMKIICVILGIILFFQIIFVFITVGRMRSDTKRRMESTIDVFVETADSVLSGIHSNLRRLVLTNINVRNINNLTNSMDVLNARRNVATSLQEIQTLYGNDFGVFVYDRKQSDFYHGWTSGWDLKVYQTVAHSLMEHIISLEEGGETSTLKWSTVTINGVLYVYGYALYTDYYACAVISEKNLFRLHNFTGYEEAQNLTVTLVTNASDGEMAGGIPPESNRFGQISVIRQLDQADFKIRVISQNNKEMQQLLWLQVLTWICSAILFILPIGSFLLTKKHILDPLRYFSENLIRYEEDGDGSYFEDSRIYELEEANKLFKKNLENMKELKIRMYEETLEKQRIEMEYTKLQINPHFYINCMNQIYNMACVEDYASIQKMSANISEYFRYIFREKSDYVNLSQELKHVEIFLDMCSLRYGKSFDYQVEITQDVSDVKIPPLLLHTFVENSVKYGMGKEYCNCIRVGVERFTAEGKELVTIEISDNGDGFPEDILERLQRHEQRVAADGTKVGISNAIYRLNYLYHGAARLNFFNREGAGAVVKLCIPVGRTRGNENEYITCG